MTTRVTPSGTPDASTLVGLPGIQQAQSLLSSVVPPTSLSINQPAPFPWAAVASIGTVLAGVAAFATSLHNKSKR